MVSVRWLLCCALKTRQGRVILDDINMIYIHMALRWLNIYWRTNKRSNKFSLCAYPCSLCSMVWLIHIIRRIWLMVCHRHIWSDIKLVILFVKPGSGIAAKCLVLYVVGLCITECKHIVKWKQWSILQALMCSRFFNDTDKTSG